MQTYSHLLISAAVGGLLRRRGVAVDQKALLVGSVIPDLAFGGLALITWSYYTWIEPLGSAEVRNAMSGALFAAMDRLYFFDPGWIAAHNFWHSLVVTTLLMMIGGWAQRRGATWGGALFWLALGAGGHALIDVATHHDDGPVLFWPLNWNYRFMSPISYWDDAHYGWLIGPLEHALDAAILLGFALRWLVAAWRWWQTRRASGPTG